ncbi:MAG: hypothetical protein ABS63_06495 [Microbacterium sp. SCN 70-27]|uniref:lipase family protein n=1 Tax=unclassified Microbacterium TaxID=2609290 RepID=UPI00086B23F6|nr:MULTISPECIES: hypothetical protein [unclassified Microbacterium]MBN9224044.1 hypothetical protein [Microbacterium sp.]ODT27940.1 MAG: hypothetical protein ABS63_06495 [Microbacterium sp. SCN 70-27]
MSTMYGADLAQLRTLAARFDQMATKLDSDRMSVGNAIQIKAWIGPVAVRFRHTWDSDHSRRLHNAAERLRAAARSLRANADDQERTSAASSPAASRSVPKTVWESTHEVDRRAPQRPGDFIREIASMDSDDGVRVEKVIGDDGKVRYLVYVNGSGSTGALSAALGWQMNLPNAFSLDNYTLDIVRNKMRDAITDPTAEVAIFGFSQGGMVAQRIADEGSFNTKVVVTVGSPRLGEVRNYGGADMYRFEHDGDPVPHIPTNAGPLHDLVTSGMDFLTGNKPPAPGNDTTYHGGGFDLGSHNLDKYADLVNSHGSDVERALAGFRGRIVADEK